MTITAAYRFANEPISDLIAAKLPASVSPIATFISESVSAADPAHIGLAVGFIIHWATCEPWPAISKELFTMGLKNFFQSAKQDAIDRIVDERADRLADERADRLADERADRLVANARANIRNEVL